MTDEMIEAVARAICDGMGLRSWDGVPADRGDLRCRVRSGKGYDVNEPTHMDYLNAAQDAIRAAAPMILDMAADEAAREKFYIHHEDCTHLGDPPEPYNDGCDAAAEAIRKLKENFQ